jgi:chaperonin GroES
MLLALCVASAVAFSPPASIALGRLGTPVRARMSTPPQDLKPMHDQVLVDLQSEPTVTEYGLLLPTVYSERLEGGFTDDQFVEKKPRAGVILAVGPGKLAEDTGKLIPPAVKAGQRCVVGPTGGIPVPQEGESEEELFIFREEQIWGIVDEG